MAIMLICSAALSISAKKYGDIEEGYHYSEQIDILSDIGIIVGTSETEFSPDDAVTREQMAMLLFRTMLARDNAGTVNTTVFEDLYDDTYNGAISWAAAAGYIIGTSATTYAPTAGITLQDAMTMIVRVLGQSNANMDRGYPWTYIDMAVKLGLDDGLRGVGYEDELTRGETAALLYNALTAEYLIPKTASASGSYYVATTIIEYVFGYEIEDAQIIATNNYALSPAETVIKDGYVTVLTKEGEMTVKFSDFGLDGSADLWLGKSVKLIFKADSKAKTVDVLGAAYTGRHVKAESFSVAADNAYVTLDGVKYNIVKQRSDALATNDNELLVYIYDADRQLAQIESNAEFAAKTGFCDIELIFDANQSVAVAAIIKNYTFGRIIEDGGKINIAGGLTVEGLTGGFANESGAVYGDYVLYYFNASNKRLEIAEKFTPTEAAIVTRLTASEATVGGKTYTLGGGGVAAADIEAALKVGAVASVIVKNDRILAVIGAAQQTIEANYLIASSAAVPVFTGGSVRYVFDANINGEFKTVVTAAQNVTSGAAYRYTVDSNGVYTLYAKDSDKFAINGDSSLIFTSEENTTVTQNGKPYYTIGGTKFVCDDKTVIVAKHGASWQVKTGAFNSSVALDKDAVVTAVFHNNPGDVETLAYMFVDGGILGRTDVTETNVQIMAAVGSEFDNGTVYRIYRALNLRTGEVGTYKSVNFELENGKIYALDTAGNILGVAGEALLHGTVAGYTASTVTIGEDTFAVNANTVIIKINADNTTTTQTLASLSGTEIDFAVTSGTVTIIIAR